MATKRKPSAETQVRQRLALVVNEAKRNFARNLRGAREACGWSQADMARRCGWEPSLVAHYEAGRRMPSFANLVVASRALGCTIDGLVGVDHIDLAMVRLAAAGDQLTAALAGLGKGRSAAQAIVDDGWGRVGTELPVSLDARLETLRKALTAPAEPAAPVLSEEDREALETARDNAAHRAIRVLCRLALGARKDG